jgi:hypothetical protein
MFIEEKKVQTKMNIKQQKKKPQNQPLNPFQDFTKMIPWNLFSPNNKKDDDDYSFKKMEILLNYIKNMIVHNMNTM